MFEANTSINTIKNVRIHLCGLTHFTSIAIDINVQAPLLVTCIAYLAHNSPLLGTPMLLTQLGWVNGL